MNCLFKRTGIIKNNLCNIKIIRNLYGITQKKYDKKNYENNSKYSQKKIIYGLLGVTTCVGLYKILDNRKKYAECSVNTKIYENSETGVFNSKLPTFSLDEVAKHDSMEKRIWVTYKQGVYDITDFIENHPGGNIILRAAGKPLETFWIIYAMHKDAAIYEILEDMRIGNISKDEAENIAKSAKDPYENEPNRHRMLEPASVKPFNAEPKASLLVDNFITPNDIFYVRNHLPVPVVDSKNYKLDIEIENENKKISLTLDELKKFTKHDVTAVLMCAGNRRSEMSEVRPVRGLNWGSRVIGNAVWSGVFLRDVLTSRLGITDDSDYKHVQFEGMDKDPVITERFYGASVPFDFVMSKHGDVILAYEMNGESLPRDHGYPIRVIVPGVCGARNVKWLSKIVISKEESKAFWQQNDYKSFNSSTDFDTADYSKADAVQKLPVTSAICYPQSGEKVRLKNGCITIKGYAYSGGGNKILRVDVTVNGGSTWHAANLLDKKTNSSNYWSWTLWSVDIPVNDKAEEVEIWVKAIDSCHNTQPETFEHIWNIRGILSNAYHRIKVKIDH